jgi:adenylate cyclase
MSAPMPGQELRAVLMGEHKGLSDNRKFLRHLPAPPRCKLCAAPFEGAGGAVLRHLGFARYRGNPALCENCIRQFTKSGIRGAEIPATLLFADIRGSTAIGERLQPKAFHDYLERFYRLGSKTILDHDGLVDKLVGDEVIGLFFGGISGPGHARAAVAAGTDLMARAGRAGATPEGPIPLGAAVHTGMAYVGPTGPEDAVEDFTALGDMVNTTARLASLAGQGELLISVPAAEAAGGVAPGAERRTLEVRGREATIDIVVLLPAG